MIPIADLAARIGIRCQIYLGRSLCGAAIVRIDPFVLPTAVGSLQSRCRWVLVVPAGRSRLSHGLGRRTVWTIGRVSSVLTVGDTRSSPMVGWLIKTRPQIRFRRPLVITWAHGFGWFDSGRVVPVRGLGLRLSGLRHGFGGSAQQAPRILRLILRSGSRHVGVGPFPLRLGLLEGAFALIIGIPIEGLDPFNRFGF